MSFVPGSQRSQFSRFLVGLSLAFAVAASLRIVAASEPTAADSPSHDLTAAESNLGAVESYEATGSTVDFTRFQDPTPSWTVTADALFLNRSNAASQGILYDNNTGSELVNTSNLGFGNQAGPRLMLLRPLGSGWVLDVEYFGIDGWSATQSAGPGDFLLIGDQSQSGPDVDSANFLYASRFRTAEINLRAPGSSWFQPLIGFRWIGLSETYQASGGFIDNSTSIPFNLRYNTLNNLYGGQIGANVILWDHGGPLTITSLNKAGLYLGDSQNTGNFTATDGPNSMTFAGNGHSRQAAFFGEVGVVANWQLNDHLSIRGGYQLYWLTGVALAANQPYATDLVGGTGGINAGGNTFMHGPSAGFQLSW